MKNRTQERSIKPNTHDFSFGCNFNFNKPFTTKRVSIFAAISLDLYDSSLDASLSGIWKLKGLKKFPRNLLKCNELKNGKVEWGRKQ